MRSRKELGQEPDEINLSLLRKIEDIKREKIARQELVQLIEKEIKKLLEVKKLDDSGSMYKFKTQELEDHQILNDTIYLYYRLTDKNALGEVEGFLGEIPASVQLQLAISNKLRSSDEGLVLWSYTIEMLDPSKDPVRGKKYNHSISQIPSIEDVMDKLSPLFNKANSIKSTEPSIEMELESAEQYNHSISQIPSIEDVMDKLSPLFNKANSIKSTEPSIEMELESAEQYNHSISQIPSIEDVMDKLSPLFNKATSIKSITPSSEMELESAEQVTAQASRAI